MRFAEIEGADRSDHAYEKGMCDDIVPAFAKPGPGIAKLEFDEEDVERCGGRLKAWWETEGTEAEKKTLSNMVSTIDGRIEGSLRINEIVDAMIHSGIEMRCKPNGERPVMPHAHRCRDGIAFEHVRPTKEMLAKHRKERTENAD